MYKKYIDEIRKRLDDKRFNHSLCVAKEARRLALKYGADADKAELAGVLHDITKQASAAEHFEIIKKYNLQLNEVELNAHKLWHSKTGAALVKFELGIDDEEIISAINYHTTAKADMTLLERVLFLADFTSEDRDYEDVDIMRALTEQSMELAMTYALKYTITDLLHKDVAIHPDTVAAYNYIKAKRGKDNERA